MKTVKTLFDGITIDTDNLSSQLSELIDRCLGLYAHDSEEGIIYRGDVVNLLKQTLIYMYKTNDFYDARFTKRRELTEEEQNIIFYNTKNNTVIMTTILEETENKLEKISNNS